MKRPPRPGFLLVAAREWRWMRRDRLALFLALGVPIFAFAILALIFSNAVVRNLRVTVVDADRSPTSRLYIQAIASAPGVSIAERSGDMTSAMHAIRSGDAIAAIYIPENFEHDLIARQRPRIVDLYNRQYFTPGNSASAAISSAIAAATATLPRPSPASGEPFAPGSLTVEQYVLTNPALNYAQPVSHFPNPIGPYTARHLAPPNLANTARIDSLMHDGKLYLSLNDAIALALENNLDIAIARYNLNIADTDVLRAKAGATTLGVNTGIVQNTPGGGVGGLGAQVGSGTGGTSLGAGGAGAGAGGLVGSTLGFGPLITSLSMGPTMASSMERLPPCSFEFGGNTRPIAGSTASTSSTGMPSPTNFILIAVTAP